MLPVPLPLRPYIKQTSIGHFLTEYFSQIPAIFIRFLSLSLSLNSYILLLYIKNNIIILYNTVII